MAAEKGYKVVGLESNADALTTGKARIEKSAAMLLGKTVKKGKMTQEEADSSLAATLGNLSFSTDKVRFTPSPLRPVRPPTRQRALLASSDASAAG